MMYDNNKKNSQNTSLQWNYRKRRIPKPFLKNSILAGTLMGVCWAFLNSYFHPLKGLLISYSRVDAFIIQTVVQGAVFIFLGVVVGIGYGMCLDLSYYRVKKIENHHLKILAVTGLLWIGSLFIIGIFFLEPENIFSSIILASVLFLFVTLRTRRD